jgi:hypothetical protein
MLAGLAAPHAVGGEAALLQQGGGGEPGCAGSEQWPARLQAVVEKRWLLRASDFVANWEKG